MADQPLDQKYLSLTTFRKTGAAVHTPVRFGDVHPDNLGNEPLPFSHRELTTGN